MLKKFVSMAAASALCMTLCSFDAAAAEVGEPVSSAYELMEMEADGDYYLTCDIDLSDTDWKAVKGFSGHFDGNGYEITGLVSEDYGLFADLKTGAEVENVKLTDAYITSSLQYAGGIVSSIKSSEKDITVKNCFVSGVVASCRTKYGKSSNVSAAGAVVGSSRSRSAVISDCYSNAVVASEKTLGGIAGINYGTIKNCGFGGQLGSSYNIYDLRTDPGKEVTDDYKFFAYLGGICGENYGKIQSCFSSCTRVDIANYYGGIAGAVQKKGSITKCVNSSYVPYDDFLKGGLIAGYVSKDSTLSNNYSRKPDETTVSNDVGDGKTDSVTYVVPDSKYGRISSFKRLGSGWKIAGGVPVLTKLETYINYAPLYEIKGGSLISLKEEEDDISVDYGYDENGDILE